ncbi:MAG: hypothetical protein WCH46_05705 [bacterium]
MKIAAFLYLTFGLLALGLGIAMLANQTLLIQFGENMRSAFIGVLFAYGLYRVWSFIGTIRKNKAAKK